MKGGAWFDVPMVYANNRRAILRVEKGSPGERVFNDAFATWESPTAPEPVTAANGTMPNNEPHRVKTLPVKGDASENGGITAAPQTADADVFFVIKDLAPVLLKAKIAANVTLDDTLMRVKDAANWGYSFSNVTAKPMAGHTAWAASTRLAAAKGNDAQRVVLYDEDPSDPKGKQYVGSVIWRTEPIKATGNQKPEIAVRADIEIPDRKFKMTMSFRRNTDTSLPASHTAELTFTQPQNFSAAASATCRAS